MQDERREIAKTFQQHIFNGHIAVFATMKQRDLVTEDLENDFLTFLETLQKMFNEIGGDFTITKVREKIPSNSWYEAFEKNHRLKDVASSKEELAKTLLQDERFARYIEH